MIGELMILKLAQALGVINHKNSEYPLKVNPIYAAKTLSMLKFLYYIQA